MNRERNIETFENLLGSVKRPGMEELLNFIRKSDFYTAPASTRFHLSCEGGLLQHSLNVYSTLMDKLTPKKDAPGILLYQICGRTVAEISYESAIIASLLHDLCKVYFYSVDYRNQKVYKDTGSKRDEGGRFDWERKAVFIVDDRNPYGHGEKSVMMIESFIKLTMAERYAIRWHMGMSEAQNIGTYNQAVEKFPFCHILHMADQEASHFVEDQEGNKELFDRSEKCSQDIGFQEAPAIGGRSDA